MDAKSHATTFPQSSTSASAPASSSKSSAVDVQAVLDKIDVDEFEWQAYEGKYRDRALITRLSHISSIILSPSAKPTLRTLLLARTTLLRILPIVKASTWDTQAYARAMYAIEATYDPERLGRGPTRSAGKADADDDEGDGEPMDVEPNAGESGTEGTGGSAVEWDSDWLDEARDAERRESARLDVELRGYLSNLIKESIRLTYFAFAQLAIKGGNAALAMKHYTAAREYSSSPQHHVDIGLGILELCLVFNLPTQLPGNISKLETFLDRLYPPQAASAASRQLQDQASTTASEVRETREREAKGAAARKRVGVQIRVGKGIVALSQEDYERCGRELSEIGEEGGLGDWDGKVISTSDVALIGALCVLATAPRDRIRRLLLDRGSFITALDDSQGWLLDLVRAFMGAQYGEVSSLLLKHQPILLLNPFLFPQVGALIELIQTRSIVQYVLPFSTISITAMAQAFAMTEAVMVNQLESLIMEKRIGGKIDLIDMILTLKAPNQRSDLYANALQVGKATVESSYAALFRMRMHEAGIVVDPRPADSKNVTTAVADPMSLNGLDGSGSMGELEITS